MTVDCHQVCFTITPHCASSNISARRDVDAPEPIRLACFYNSDLMWTFHAGLAVANTHLRRCRNKSPDAALR
jgi:hypothetical protein